MEVKKMWKKNQVALIAGITVCLLLGITGCEIPSAKYEITVHMSAPLAPGSSFSARTHNGAVTLKAGKKPAAT